MGNNTMAQGIKLEDILATTRELTPADKVRLIERLSVEVRSQMQKAGADKLRPLRGIWHQANTSSEDIDEARREMWGNVPRQNI